MTNEDDGISKPYVAAVFCSSCNKWYLPKQVVIHLDGYAARIICEKCAKVIS